MSRQKKGNKIKGITGKKPKIEECEFAECNVPANMQQSGQKAHTKAQHRAISEH